jgi:NAD(P)-dependent dehydrogenase (short-subunit alcohol dehydrogenase family)
VARTILVCGYGPGISSSVARKFGAEGFDVALVARSADKLQTGVDELSKAGVNAKAFPCDLADPAAVTKLVTDVREALGPIHTIHYNAYYGGAGDLTTCDLDELRRVFDVGVVGAVAAVQASLPDLRQAQGASVLITGGGFSKYVPQVDKMTVQWNAMGLGLAKAAQHKLTGLLHEKLADDGIYVGSVVVLGMVKGTAFDQGGEGLAPDAIADRFWALAQARDVVSVDFPS